MVSQATDLPPLNALRAFEAAGRHLTFRGAAEELGVTQGAVAQHVRALEARLKAPLFERHARGLLLTDAGQRFHIKIAAAFRLLEDATTEIRPARRQITLAVPAAFAEDWVRPRAARFAQGHPDIDLSVRPAQGTLQPSPEDADVVVQVGTLPDSGAFEQHALSGQQVIAVCAPGVLTPGQGMSGATLLHDVLDLWPDFIARVLGLPRPDRLAGKRLGEPLLAYRAALRGEGVALADLPSARADLAEGRLLRAAPGVLRDVAGYTLIAPKARMSDTAVARVVTWLTAEAQRDVEAPVALTGAM